MSEIEEYAKKYQNGLFIEPISQVFSQLRKNLQACNEKYGTNFKPIKSLVSDQEGKDYTFHIFDNNGASSSIYQANLETWEWPYVREMYTVSLQSTTIATILKEQEWESTHYDVIIDVQGAEYLVLQGFGEQNLSRVQSLKTEISKIPYYEGGVLFDELHSFLTTHGFQLESEPASNHCDVLYQRVERLVGLNLQTTEC